MNSCSSWSDDESSEEEILITSQPMMHHHNFQRESARNHHVVSICDGPSEAFNCGLQITSMSTLNMVGELLETLERKDMLEWNWGLSQYTFDLQRVPDIIACLQKHVYIPNMDILHYSTQLTKMNKERYEASRAMAEDAAAGNSIHQDWDEDLEMEKLATKQCTPESSEELLDIEDPDEGDTVSVRPSNPSLKPPATTTSSPKVLPSPRRKGAKCSELNCKKISRVGGKCRQHGAGGKRCSELNCNIFSHKEGKCLRHGKKCSTQDCEVAARIEEKCKRHYEAELCHIHGNPVTRSTDGKCSRQTKKRKTKE